MMSLTTITTSGSSRVAILYNTTCTTHNTHPIPHRHVTIPTRTSHIASAKKLSTRTGRFESKKKRSTEEEEEERPTAEIESVMMDGVDGGGGGVLVNSEGKVMPVLEGLEKCFWEGPQWDGLGFFVQYMWAFGVMFALVACGVAVATYNDGATDFKETPAYKESIQSGDLLEGPDSSSSDIFETNPTEVAPSLE